MRNILGLLGISLLSACGDGGHPEHMVGLWVCTDPVDGRTSTMSLNADGRWVGESATREITWRMEGDILSQHADGAEEPSVRMQIEVVDADHIRKRYFSTNGMPMSTATDCVRRATAAE